MNKTKLTDTQYSALEKVAQQFAAWRETRTKRGRIPDTLWSAAVDLFRSYGLSINKIAQTLRLNYTDLKLHITESPPVVMQPIEDESATFVELGPPLVTTDCVIEMEKPSGAKLRMCFRGRADPVAVDLGRYFLEGLP